MRLLNHLSFRGGIVLLAVGLTGCSAIAPGQSAEGPPGQPTAGTLAQAAVVAPAPTPTLAPNPAVAGRVHAVVAADKQVLPDNHVSITLHAGYATHDNDKATTSGLSNVPVGTPVYLEGIGSDAHDVKVTAWQWQLSAPAFSAAKLDNARAQYPSFTADRAGTYQLRVTATNEKGEATTSSFTVNAGVYAGAQSCATCHSGSVQPDMVSAWQQTNHARKVETTYASYSATSDYCIQCHTTGYNEADKARGFDDRAVASGWDSSQGSLTEWLVGRGTTMSQLMASPMGALANVQCEACHGPGGSSHTGVKSFETGVCAQCHSAQPAQWTSSGHANTGRNNLHTAENADCVKCHTGQGFVEVTVRGNAPVFPNAATKDKPANLMVPTDQPPISCVTCHDPHTATFPNEPREGHSLQLRMKGNVQMPNGTTVDAEFGAVCVTCHADRRTVEYMQAFLDGKQARGVHDNTQADVLYGTGAITYGEALRTSGHANAPEACVTCHMAANPVMDPGKDGQAGTRDDVKAQNVGGHSWNMEAKYTGLFQGKQVTDQTVENTGACNAKGCHAGSPLTTFNQPAQGDWDGNGKTEGIQTEIQGLLKVVADRLPKDQTGAVIASGINDKNTTREQRQALWNYWLVNNDGSKGIHNPSFTVQLLQKTYKHLVGSDVPNARIYR